jgi:hypothetical protein
VASKDGVDQASTSIWINAPSRPAATSGATHGGATPVTSAELGSIPSMTSPTACLS